MNLFLVDDDPQIIHALRIIIEQNHLGKVCGVASNGREALEELPHAAADIVLVDLLMPVMDGISFIQAARELDPALHFIMISYVSNEGLVSQAYEAGIEFYIHKPINSIEVCAVVRRVQRLRQLEATFVQMQTLVQGSGPAPRSDGPAETPEAPSAAANLDNIQDVLRRLGLGGDPVCREILQMVDHLHRHRAEGAEPTVFELCGLFSLSPKALEQRIRRALTTGMVNLANMGLEDYGEETFTEFASTLYSFKEVRQEMECIRGKSKKHGKVSIRNFLYALAGMVKTDNTTPPIL